MTLLVVSGAEEAIAVVGLAAAGNQLWTAIAGVPAIETSVVRSGARSYRFAAAVTLPWVRHAPAASQSVAYLRCYFRTTNATPSSDLTFVYVDSGTGASSGYITLKTTGVVQASFNGGTGGQNSAAISANTWYGLEAEFDIHANPNVIRWRVWDASNGWVRQTDVSVSQAAATWASGHTLGIVAGPTSGTTIYLDDIVCAVGTTAAQYYDPGAPAAGKVLRYLPNADGAHSAFTAGDFKNTAGTNFTSASTDVNTYVDDDDQTSIADYVQQAVAGAGKYVRLKFADESAEDKPRFVGVTSTHHSSGTAANEMHLRVSDDGTNWSNVWGDWSATGVDTSDTTAHHLHKCLETAPSGGSWTQAKVNSLEAEWGNSDDVTPFPFLDSVSIQVDWLEQSLAAFVPTRRLAHLIGR